MTSEGRTRSRQWSMRAVLLFLAVLSLATKLPRLGFPPRFYFDEIYHGFTAGRYLHSDPQAYDVFASAPKGMAFEWTHPPLAKLIMTGMMVMGGENLFALRLGSVLAGTGATLLVALLAYELLASTVTAAIAGSLLCFEGLFFAQSRIAMNDAYFCLFMLLTLYLYAKWRREPGRKGLLLGVGTALGLSLSTKWTGLYLLPILFIDQAAALIGARDLEAKERCRLVLKRSAEALTCLLILPAAVYCASYLQMFHLGYGFGDFIALQKQMWHYHTHLAATHSYQSKPLQWVFNLRPVWFFVDAPGADGSVTNIYNLGNSVILIAGFASAIWALAAEKKDPALRLLLLSYFLLWVPWLFSPRIMLFYHYTPAVTILCILLARTLSGWVSSGEQWLRAGAIGVIGLSVCWFAIFYPHLTGLPVWAGFAEHVYFFLPSWR